MIDTPRIAEEPESGGFPPGQAQGLAKAIASTGVDKRLRGLEVKVGVQTVLGGRTLAAVPAVFWQLHALRGEVSGLAAETRVRLGVVEQQIGALRAPIERAAPAPPGPARPGPAKPP